MSSYGLFHVWREKFPVLLPLLIRSALSDSSPPLTTSLNLYYLSPNKSHWGSQLEHSNFGRTQFQSVMRSKCQWCQGWEQPCPICCLLPCWILQGGNIWLCRELEPLQIKVGGDTFSNTISTSLYPYEHGCRIRKLSCNVDGKQWSQLTHLVHHMS